MATSSMRIWYFIASFCAVAACAKAEESAKDDDDDTTSSSSGSGASSGGGSGGAEPVCNGTGFELSPAAWTLPDYGVDSSGAPPLRYVTGDAYCPAGGRLRHQTMDMDGDGLVELVVSENCSSDAVTGASQWLVHRNDGEGFAAEASSWMLPDYGVDSSGAAPLRFVAGDGYCPAGGRLRHQTLDLHGDGKPDLVVSENCESDNETGTSRWLVHENTTSGFAPQATSWTLPDYGVDSSGAPPLRLFANDAYCPAAGRLRHQVVDMNGDRLPDLVVSENCASDTDTGSTQWRVHLNSGSGFAAEATAWALPDYGVDSSGASVLRVVNGDAYCPAEGRLRHQLLDLSGDALPDLVVSENCASDTLTGATQWRVHLNTGSGFAADATSWTLPDYGVDSSGAPPLRLVAGDAYCPAEGRLRHQVVDLSGDRLPDLVVTENCAGDTLTGATQWRVHLNDGSGFASNPIAWPIPDYGVDSSGSPALRYVAGDAYCPSEGRLRFQILQLVTPGAVDLVVSENCANDTLTGATQWRLHRVICESQQ